MFDVDVMELLVASLEHGSSGQRKKEVEAAPELHHCVVFMTLVKDSKQQPFQHSN